MSARFEPDEIKLEGLEKLTKALKVKNPPHVRVGVLKAGARQEGVMDNASIGAVHEYGSPAMKIPARSFLRAPLRDHFSDEMKRSGLLGEKELKKVVKDGNIRPWLESVKLLAKATVLEAFSTEGWGAWKQWSASYAKRKKKGTDNMILDDTGQLRNSIDAEVVE